MSFALPTAAASAALAVLLFPEEALAWGPVAHVDVGLGAVSAAASLAGAIRAAILAHPRDFLFGNVAADVTVGKNLASGPDHCHSWEVASRLLEASRGDGDERRAFALGYLAHLGADAVAHNRFVPLKLLSFHGARGVGHLFWEARFDERILRASPDVAKAWEDVSAARFPEHVAFLARLLKPALLPNAVSSRVFRRLMILQRRGPWRRALRRIDSASRLELGEEEVDGWRRAALGAALEALGQSDDPTAIRSDPTGRAALAAARAGRARLRKLARRAGSAGGTERLLERELEALDLAEGALPQDP